MTRIKQSAVMYKNTHVCNTTMLKKCWSTSFLYIAYCHCGYFTYLYRNYIKAENNQCGKLKNLKTHDIVIFNLEWEYLAKCWQKYYKM